MFNVHLRINDAATGQPTPVRLRITDANGRVYPPLGRLAEFATGKNEDVGGHLVIGRERWCYIDGSCEVPLPSGVPLTVEATKGPEFRPLRHQVTLGPGQMALRLAIDRWAYLANDGWYSGDTRCHFLSPHAALLESMAEGVAVTQLLATLTQLPAFDGAVYSAVPNMVAFSGQVPALERDGHLVAVNTLNAHPVLGTLALLHCHRAVFPLTFGGADSTDDWSLADWCDQCHRKKGLVVWVDPFRQDLPVAPEALADLIQGRIDAVECSPASIRIREWYRAWSAGIRFSLVGASGKESNRTPLGTMRTYARLDAGEPLTLATWIEAVRAGRTFVTNGPVISLKVNGQGPGGAVDLSRPGESVVATVELNALPPSAPDAELIVNGIAVARHPLVSNNQDFLTRSFEVSVPIDAPSWIAVRCGTTANQPFAHTSPLFIRVDGRMPADAAVIDSYAASLTGTVEWVDTVGRFENPRRRDQLRAVLEQARQELLGRKTAS